MTEVRTDRLFTYFGDGRLDWERTLQTYATDEGKSFGDVMTWLSKRPSLAMCAQLLGIEEPKKDLLQSLGKFMDEKGYTPPRLNAPGEYNHGLPARSQRDVKPEKPRKRSAPKSQFGLSKEEYLLKRIAGMKRATIAKEQGITQSALYPHLRNWGIKDPILEEAAMEELRSKQKTVIQVSEKRSAAEPKRVDSVDKSIESVDNGHVPNLEPNGSESVKQTATNPLIQPDALREIFEMFFGSNEDGAGDAPADIQFVTLHIPMRRLNIPQQSLVAAGRAQIISDVFVAAQRAVGWIFQDLSELLGTDDVQEQAQQYFDRQLADFMKESMAE